MEEDERRLSFPPPAPLHSPGEEIDGSRLLGEIVRTLEATNPEAVAPLVASQSRDALDAEEEEKPRREELRIPLDVTFSESVGRSDEPRAVVTPFTRESAKRAGSRGAQLVREFGFMPRRRLSVEDGARLPRKYEPFPPKLYGRPLEEIDNFIYDETKSTFNFAGDVVTQVQKFGDGRVVTIKRTFKGNELVTEITSSTWDGVARRIYTAA